MAKKVAIVPSDEKKFQKISHERLDTNWLKDSLVEKWNGKVHYSRLDTCLYFGICTCVRFRELRREHLLRQFVFEGLSS